MHTNDSHQLRRGRTRWCGNGLWSTAEAALKSWNACGKCGENFVAEINPPPDKSAEDGRANPALQATAKSRLRLSPRVVSPDKDMKRLIIAVAGFAAIFGAGFAAGFLYHSGVFTARWNDRALVGTFRSAWLEGDRGKESPVFFYIVENRSGVDYFAHDASDVQVLVRCEGALDNSWGPGLSIDLPLFIPAGEKASITVHFRMLESNQPKSSAQSDVQAFIKEPKRSWNRCEGFVLLDKRYRYRLSLPKSW